MNTIYKYNIIKKTYMKRMLIRIVRTRITYKKIIYHLSIYHSNKNIHFSKQKKILQTIHPLKIYYQNI